MPKATPRRSTVPNHRAWTDPTADAIKQRSEDEGAPPRPTTVYFLNDHDGDLLYVGISAAKLGIARFHQHAGDKDWWTEVASIDVEHFPTEAHARQREASVIRTLKPLYNKQAPNRGRVKHVCACRCGRPVEKAGWLHDVCRVQGREPSNEPPPIVWPE